MLTYTIQHTQTSGDYLIRDQADRQLARFPTEAEAVAYVEGRKARDAQDEADAQARREANDAFDATVPDLNERQLRWQAWRSWLYAENADEDRQLARARRAMDRQAGSFAGRPSFEKHESDLTRQEIAAHEAALLYERAVAVDGRVKQARRERDAAALEAALDEADALLPDIRAAHPWVMRPNAPLTYACERCGHVWFPRSGREPRVCPQCKSPYWDKPRGETKEA